MADFEIVMAVIVGVCEIVAMGMVVVMCVVVVMCMVVDTVVVGVDIGGGGCVV